MAKRRDGRAAWNVHTRRLETEIGGGWMVIEQFNVVGGRQVVEMLTICPAPPPDRPGVAQPGRVVGEPPIGALIPKGGITARLLRTVKVGRGTDALEDYKTWLAGHFGSAALVRLEELVGNPGQRHRSGKPRASDLYYAALAKDYVDLWNKGVKAPIGALAKLHRVSPEKIRSHVHLARSGGFLTKAKTVGAKGGELTAKSHRLLAVAEESLASTTSETKKGDN